MASKLYRLRIATAGASAVTGFVDSTITSSQLADVPRIPGAIARTLDGRTEAQGWSATMLSSAIVGNLADADGRPDLGGRLCDWSESTDLGTTYTVVWTGRLTGLSSPDPATFKVDLEDERWLERRSTIFTNSNTSQLYPPGPRAEFRPAYPKVEGGPTKSMRVLAVDGTDVLKVSWTVRGQLTEEAAEFIRGDKIDASNGRKNQGNFTHTRININGTDREVISFSELRMSPVTAGVDPDELVPVVWVHWPMHGQSEGSTLGGATTFECFLYAPTAPPSEALPLHIGGTAGIDPATLAQNIYNGDYGALDEVGNPVVVRADTSALVTSTTLVWYRVTAPQNMAKWLEDNIYRPLLWCPFTNTDGKVVPRSVRLPQNIDYAALTVLNASNAYFPYPDWDFNTRGAITSFIPETVEYQRDFDSPDYMTEVVKARTPEDHDNIARLGRRGRTVRFPAMIDHSWYARELFERVGDGMVRIPQINVRDSLAGIDSGDFVELDHDTLKLPSLTTNARTGASIWQVVKKDRLEPGAFGLELEYVGPSLQKLTAPTVAVAQNVDDPENSIDVTISGLLAGEGYILRVDRGDGYVIEGGGTGNETVTVGPGSKNGGCPSGTLISVGAATTKVNRIRSAYTTATVTTASLTAPSLLAATATSRTISLTWTNGETNFGVMPTLGGADVLPEPLPPGSTAFVFDELAASTLYTVGVKHVDEYGGASTLTTTTATTGTAATLSAPTQFRLTQKRDAATDPLPPVTILGVGLEVGYLPGDESAATDVQVATDSGFATVIATALIPAGQERSFVRTGLRGLLYVRARHTRAGYTDSAWTATVSGYATALRHKREPTPKDIDQVPDGTTYRRIRDVVTDGDGRVRVVRRSGGVDVDADNVQDWSTETLADKDSTTFATGTNKTKKLAANTEADGDVYIVAASVPKVGTVAIPSSIAKDLIISAAELIPASDATSWTIAGDAAISPGVTGSAQFFYGALIVPPGVTITQVSAAMSRVSASDGAEVKFYKANGVGVTPTLIATLTHSTTGSQTVTAATSELVSASNRYFISVTVSSVTSVTDAKFGEFGLDYTMPDYSKSI